MLRRRIVYSDAAFAEFVIWRVPRPLVGSSHPFKYRLAYVVDDDCVIRYDNESGKGDHRHFVWREEKYVFSTLKKLLSDFKRDIARWHVENRDS